MRKAYQRTIGRAVRDTQCLADVCEAIAFAETELIDWDYKAPL